MRKSFILVCTLVLSSLSYGFDQSHQLFEDVLKKHNADGLISYKQLKEDPSTLNQYLESLDKVSTTEFQKWTNDQKLAYWINAYNAYTLKAIIDNYPIKSSFFKSALYPKNSIRQIDGVWDKLKFGVMGQKKTLNNIEHDIIRKDFNEARIHAALVCAALGCPRLREEAYTGDKLEAQLADDAKRFLALPFQFKIDRDKKIVHLSSIFKWFGEDFDKQYGSVIEFAQKYVDEKDASYLKKGDFKTEYLDYDWTLNEQ